MEYRTEKALEHHAYSHSIEITVVSWDPIVFAELFGISEGSRFNENEDYEENPIEEVSHVTDNMIEISKFLPRSRAAIVQITMIHVASTSESFKVCENHLR